ncbi:MAG: hypothetical protein MUQ20_03275, partial [Deltaproteobacteria bacterium]|nr:hypothetical protein [Deltaproteobacteria bacterium]
MPGLPARLSHGRHHGQRQGGARRLGENCVECGVCRRLNICPEGAQKLIKPCVCGIGNPQRIEKLLGKMTAGEK